MMLRVVIGLVLYCLSCGVVADEIRPGYLELTETQPELFSVLWKVPAKGDRKLGLEVQLPDNCRDRTTATAQLLNGAFIQRWIVHCAGGLVDKSIAIAGLEMTSTDVLLRMVFIERESQFAQLTPDRYSYQVPAEASSLQIIATYTWLGIEHILRGVDHLLFVFALLLIVNSTRRLVATITAFTVAHSITLAAATMGVVQVPQQPVEAAIALSILFLAMEIVHGKRGRPGAAARWPWLVAFIFGLLHGFGFAGALAEVGLPSHAIPLALVFFNLGVELGQLLFVALVLLLGWLLHQLKQTRLVDLAETLAIYTIGSLATFWLFERVSAF